MEPSWLDSSELKVVPNKKGAKKCIHGRQKAFCKLCGGSGLCKHNKNKYYCKDCGTSGNCSHQEALQKEAEEILKTEQKEFKEE